MKVREIILVSGVPCSLGALDLLYLLWYAYVIYPYMVIQGKIDTWIVMNNIPTLVVLIHHLLCPTTNKPNNTMKFTQELDSDKASSGNAHNPASFDVS